MRIDGLPNERLALVRLRLDQGGMHASIETLRDRDLEQPQLFDVTSDDVLVCLYLQLGNVVFLSGSDRLADYLDRPGDLARFVELRQTVREERTGRTVAFQQRTIGTCERSLVSHRDTWRDLCPPDGDDGYHVIGMDEERRRVFAFRSAPGLRADKYQLCYATVSVADRPIKWLPLSSPPDPETTFVDAARFVRVRRDGETVGVQSIVRLTSRRGIDEHRLFTVEESPDGPVARWSDPFSAEYPVLGPDWRTSGPAPSDVPPALLLQERALGGYALHRLLVQDCPVQQLYAYFVNAGNI